MTKIDRCGCKYPAQDEMYGQGNRVFNYSAKSSGWRCTVCGSVKSGPKKEVKK